jgi:hypothetical protein
MQLHSPWLSKMGAERVGADGAGADGFGLPLDLDGLCMLFDLVVGVSLDGVSVEGVGAEGVGTDGIGGAEEVGAKGVGAERFGADSAGADGFGLPLDLDGLCLRFDFIVGVSLDGVGAEGV